MDRLNDHLTVRQSVADDAKYINEWLLDDEILPWFPLQTEKEVEDAVRIWLSYTEKEASLTAEYDGKVCAMVVVYLHHYKKLRHQSLFCIVVSEEFRGKGIGKAFLEYVFKYAKEKLKVEVLHLEVYLGNPAERLYRRLGFTEYGRHESFLKEADGNYRTKIMMEKEL